ncbi:MAG: sugar transferase [Planctomycetota bacterium]|nr:MAG: sugar transferase [Planctomycetota bacterium]
MLRRHRLLIHRLLVYFDAGLVLLTYAAGVRFRGWFVPAGSDFWRSELLHSFLALLSIFVVLAGYQLAGLYQSQRMRTIVGEAGRILLVNGLCFLFLLALLTGLKAPPANLVAAMLFQTLNAGLGISTRLAIRTIARIVRRRGYNYRHLVVVADAKRDPAQLLRKILAHDYWGFRVMAVVYPPAGEEPEWDGEHLPGNPPVLAREQLIEFIDKEPIDEIWVDGLPDDSGATYDLAAAAAEQGIALRYCMPQNFFPGVRWGFDNFEDLTTVSAAHSPMTDIARVIKRAIDVTVASVILVAAAPLMLVVAVLLMLERNGGGVLFRQERVGLNGRLFTCYKFRTMVPDAEKRRAELEKFNEMGGPVFKMKRDPRITPLGAILRKFSIDELPQLFNVLKGNMSLVGPRPPIPSEVDLYQRNQKRRLSVKPGITGLWQVSGRNEISDFEEWVRLDLEYIDKWSLMLDLKILLKTIPAVFLAKGAR